MIFNTFRCNSEIMGLRPFEDVLTFYNSIKLRCNMTNISEQDVHKALSQIRHPVIDRNIIELGIIRTITIENNLAVITMAFPFIGAPAKNISIRNQMINDVKKAVENFGLKFQLKEMEMTPEEFSKFLAIEKETWKGIATD